MLVTVEQVDYVDSVGVQVYCSHLKVNHQKGLSLASVLSDPNFQASIKNESIPYHLEKARELILRVVAEQLLSEESIYSALVKHLFTSTVDKLIPDIVWGLKNDY